MLRSQPIQRLRLDQCQGAGPAMLVAVATQPQPTRGRGRRLGRQSDTGDQVDALDAARGMIGLRHLPSMPQPAAATVVASERFLVRRVLQRRGPDLVLEAVEYWPLPGIPGLLTGEPPERQGIGDLPNLPPLSGGTVATAHARLRVTRVASAVERLRLWRDGARMPPDDGGGLGMLVPHPRLASAEPSPVFRCRDDPFGFAFRGLITDGGGRRQVAGLPLAPALGLGPDHALISFRLEPGVEVMGLGEQFSGLIHNGRRLELRCEDALGCGTGRAYKPVPVLHVGPATLFLHTPAVVRADVGATDASLLILEVEEPQLDLFVIGGGDLKQRLRRYTDLTGRAPVPPLWALGLWMSRCRYRNRAELEEAARGMREHRVPCDVLNIDPDWLELDRLNCDFRWSQRKFPDPEGMIRELADLGYRVAVWELPYIDRASPLYEQAATDGHLVRSASGVPAAAQAFSPDGRPRGLVDFSRPQTRVWWQDLHRELLRIGVVALTTDYGEGLPDDAVMADGRLGRLWHNLYPLWYNRTAFETVADLGLVFGRSGWAGSQRYPAQWGGDAEASVSGMAASLRGGLSYALSAPGFWSHDIGGFYGQPSPALYVRWAQFGLLSPLARAHGLGPREPWHFGERALRIFRRFAELRYRLLPYLARAAHQTAAEGLPVLRPLTLEFPFDPGCRGIELQYLLGPDLLVCPVLSESETPVALPVYLPAGVDWVDWWSGQCLAGGRWITVRVPLERLPLYRRAAAEIELGPAVQHTGQLATVRTD
jgi:alpha-D-xyloside xylohydrolase